MMAKRASHGVQAALQAAYRSCTCVQIAPHHLLSPGLTGQEVTIVERGQDLAALYVIAYCVAGNSLGNRVLRRFSQSWLFPNCLGFPNRIESGDKNRAIRKEIHSLE